MSRRGRPDDHYDDDPPPPPLHSNRHSGMSAAAAGYAAAAAASGHVRSAPSPSHAPPRSHIVPSRRRAGPNSRPQQQHAHHGFVAASASRVAAAAASHSHAASSIAAEPAPAERRPAKRVKMEEAAAASSSSAAAAAPAPKAAAMHSQHKEDLVCTVCQELPPGEIFQCGEGHLLCKACHRRILLSVRPQCPICRMRLSRNNPSRNRFAERVKDEMQVACTNSPCPELIKHAELPKHLASCGFRPTKCAFRPLGCDWTGPVNQRGRHEKECTVHSLSPRELLDAVKKRNVKYQEAKEQIRSTAALQAHLCRMLSKRCRDMVIRDLLIEPDPHTGELATHPFRAVGLSWEVVMDKAPAGLDPVDVKIHLRIVDRPQRKLILECFVLSGPDLTFELSPTLRRVVFRKSVGLSESFPLPVTAEQARQIHRNQTLSLRIGFVDCTLGPLTQDFTSARLPQHYTLRDDALSDDDSSNDGSDHDRADTPVPYPDDVDDDGFDDEPIMDDYLDADAPEPAAEGSDGESAHDHAQQHQHLQDDGEQPPQFDDEDILPPTLEEEEAAQELDAYEGEADADVEGEVGEGVGDSFDGEAVDDVEDDDDDDDEPQHAQSAASSSSAAAAVVHSSMGVYSQPAAYSSRPAASPAPRAYSQR